MAARADRRGRGPPGRAGSLTLLIELFEDGGIRLVPPTGNPGIATATETIKWVDVAVANGDDIRVTGHVAAPRGRAILERLGPDVPRLVVEASDPTPFLPGWTSLMWAAEHGLVAETTDLLERDATSGGRGSSTPYRLAMRRGHIPVMAVLRDAGREDPVLRRPPGAPMAVVMRPFIGWVWWWLAPLPLLAGAVAGAVSRSWMPLVVGALAAVAVALVGLLAHVLAGRTAVAADGPLLYTRRFWRWRGPVDLRQLVAVGLRESGHRRSPTLLRLANDEHGEPFRRPTTHGGFDDATVQRLRARAGLRVLTVFLAWNYLRPGLERYVASFVDDSTTLVSDTARATISRPGR